MKKRLTLSLPVELIKYIKDTAKERGITASQLVTEMLLQFIAEEESKKKLKRVS